MGCHKLTYYPILDLVKNEFRKELTLNKSALKGCRAYLYSFQGQEHDDEIKGAGNSINYKYRMHDPRLGRFFAIDPLTSKYPWYSPYVFSGNEVIATVELEGLEPEKSLSEINKMVEDGQYAGWIPDPNGSVDEYSFLCTDCEGWNGQVKMKPVIQKVTANDIKNGNKDTDSGLGGQIPDDAEFLSESYEYFERNNNSDILKDITVPKETDFMRISFQTGTEADVLTVKDADGNILLDTGPILNNSDNPNVYEVVLDPNVDRSGITFETSSTEQTSLGVVEVDFLEKKK